MHALTLPPEVLSVVTSFRSCEFATLAKDGTPITWPTFPFFNDEAGVFVVTTSIAFPQKAFNVRRNPHVSLHFSDPTGSGLENPAIVLIQGTAEASDKVETSIRGYEDRLREVFQRQPSSAIYSSNPLMRYYFDWYYMRLQITVTPHRLRWWPAGDYSKPSQVLEFSEQQRVQLD